MCKFKNIILNPRHNLFSNLHYIPEIQNCYRKYSKYLQDDFVRYENDISAYIEHCFPYFWAVTTFDNRFMGFVCLDNFVGGGNNLYGAELTTCFDRRAWGSFTRYSAKIFLKKCFDNLGLNKIKCYVYPENFRTSALLKSSGFVYESTLKSETLRGGKPQDIDVYGLYRNYYYKQEVTDNGNIIKTFTGTN